MECMVSASILMPFGELQSLSDSGASYLVAVIASQHIEPLRILYKAIIALLTCSFVYLKRVMYGSLQNQFYHRYHQNCPVLISKFTYEPSNLESLPATD